MLFPDFPKIVIRAPEADWTPPGKRTAGIVTTARGGRQLRWYVSGRIYRRLPNISDESARLTAEWLKAGAEPAAIPDPATATDAEWNHDPRTLERAA